MEATKYSGQRSDVALGDALGKLLAAYSASTGSPTEGVPAENVQTATQIRPGAATCQQAGPSDAVAGSDDEEAGGSPTGHGEPEGPPISKSPLAALRPDDSAAVLDVGEDIPRDLGPDHEEPWCASRMRARHRQWGRQVADQQSRR